MKENNLPRKAVLLLDNAPVHPNAEALQDGDIKSIFLPPKVTTICQPMDQDVFENIKRKYHRKLLSKEIEEIVEEVHDMIEKLKPINVKDVAYWVTRADVRASIISKSWKKLLCDDESMETEKTNETEENSLPGYEKIVSLDIRMDLCKKSKVG